MEKSNVFSVAGQYLKQHIKSIAVAVLCFALSLTVFFLFRLDTSAVFYALLLCVFVTAVFTAFDFTRYYRKHQQLAGLKKEILYSTDHLPVPKNLIEQDYVCLIESLFSDKVENKSKADKAYREMIDYYTLWAHQIKTPIAAMRLILQSEDATQNAQLLAELFKTEQYVQMVLSYLRLGSRFTDFVFREYALDDMVKQAVRKYAPLFIAKKIRVDIRDTGKTVVTDEKWFVFVLEQLLSNALKYTATGTISIFEQNGELVIADTGIGIAPEDLPRICDKGYTGYNGRTDKKATGIGLYLCKRILDKLSHNLRFESQVSKGTKVFISLEREQLTIE